MKWTTWILTPEKKLKNSWPCRDSLVYSATKGQVSSLVNKLMKRAETKSNNEFHNMYSRRNLAMQLQRDIMNLLISVGDHLIVRDFLAFIDEFGPSEAWNSLCIALKRGLYFTPSLSRHPLFVGFETHTEDKTVSDHMKDAAQNLSYNTITKRAGK